jgi:hypothetical protein
MDEAHIATAPRARLLARIRASNLFRRDTPVANYKDAIGWWESRRVPYNLVVGIAGTFSGYTGGWIAEIFIRKLWPHEADRFATTSFFLGLLFSVFLTLIPGILVVAGGLFGLTHHILRVVRV